MKRIAVAAIALFAFAAVLPFQYFRPVSVVAATSLVPVKQRVPGDPPSLAWPSRASAAVSVIGLGSLGTHSDSTPRPMASIAKVMTALVVIDDHPLVELEEGPPITITAEDAQSYRASLAEGQSVVKVEEGEILSEFQVLQGLLIPSGNNMAAVIAQWDAGSIDAFVAKMNQKGATLGMKRTHFADPSGFSEQTVGTARDLIVAGEALIKVPVLARMVAQGQADLPVAGTVFNINYALGSEGIFGIKTGSAPKAGACFLFASFRTLGDLQVTVIGAVLGEPTLDDAFDAARRLIGTVMAGLLTIKAVRAAEPVAAYSGPWGSRARIVAEKDLDVLAWPGLVLNRVPATPSVLPPLKMGTPAGRLEVWVGTGSRQSVPLATDGPLYAPGDFWRLTRPLSDSA